jgi:hypothetical protein
MGNWDPIKSRENLESYGIHIPDYWKVSDEDWNRIGNSIDPYDLSLKQTERELSAEEAKIQPMPIDSEEARKFALELNDL